MSKCVLFLMARCKRLPTVSLCYSVSSHGELRARLAKELPESEFGIGWALEAIYALPRKGDVYHPKQGTGRKKTVMPVLEFSNELGQNHSTVWL